MEDAEWIAAGMLLAVLVHELQSQKPRATPVGNSPATTPIATPGIINVANSTPGATTQSVPVLDPTQPADEDANPTTAVVSSTPANQYVAASAPSSLIVSIPQTPAAPAPILSSVPTSMLDPTQPADEDANPTIEVIASTPASSYASATPVSTLAPVQTVVAAPAQIAAPVANSYTAAPASSTADPDFWTEDTI